MSFCRAIALEKIKPTNNDIVPVYLMLIACQTVGFFFGEATRVIIGDIVPKNYRSVHRASLENTG